MEKANLINEVTTEVISDSGDLISCPMGKLRKIYIEKENCFKCPHFIEVIVPNALKRTKEKIHCIIPTKHYNDVVSFKVEKLLFPEKEAIEEIPPKE